MKLTVTHEDDCADFPGKPVICTCALKIIQRKESVILAQDEYIKSLESQNIALKAKLDKKRKHDPSSKKNNQTIH